MDSKLLPFLLLQHHHAQNASQEGQEQLLNKTPHQHPSGYRTLNNSFTSHNSLWSVAMHVQLYMYLHRYMHVGHTCMPLSAAIQPTIHRQ